MLLSNQQTEPGRTDLHEFVPTELEYPSQIDSTPPQKNRYLVSFRFTLTFPAYGIFVILQFEHAEIADLGVQISFGKVRAWPMSRRVS